MTLHHCLFILAALLRAVSACRPANGPRPCHSLSTIGAALEAVLPQLAAQGYAFGSLCSNQ